MYKKTIDKQIKRCYTYSDKKAIFIEEAMYYDRKGKTRYKNGNTL